MKRKLIAMAPVELPQIAEPCGQVWEEMPGTARVRHCDVCAKDVVNTAAMSAAEIRAMLAGPLPCLRIARNDDGSLVTTEPAVSYRPRFAAGVLTAAMSFGAAAAQSGQPQATMGVPPVAPQASVTGRVVGPAGRPVGHLQVALLRDGEMVNRLAVGPGGKFTLAAVPGKYELRVYGDGVAERNLPIDLEKQVVLKEPIRVQKAVKQPVRTYTGPGVTVGKIVLPPPPPAPPLVPAVKTQSVTMGFLAAPARKAPEAKPVGTAPQLLPPK